MILANVIFGSPRGKNREDLEEAIESYLAALFRGGQICGERFLTLTRGKLNAHVLLAAPEAVNLKFHTSWGKKSLAEVVRVFGREPVWKILDDDAGKTSSRWKGSPSLYLFTNLIDWYSPVCRGDGKRAVPLFSLPVSDQIKDDVYCWQKNYKDFDSVWMGSGALEVPAYRQMAELRSDLSEEGRRLCRETEEGTGIPTFYYLVRYYAWAKDEADRPCPGCGRAWRTTEPEQGGKFHQFHFRCEPCRLVSHLGVSSDGARLARIGDFVPKDL